MWKPTTNTNTESDNKKKEFVEGEGSYDKAAFEAAVAKHINPNYSRSDSVSGNQHTLNDFGNNSKKGLNIEETQDSGYLSGTISSSIIDSAEIQDQDITAPSSEKVPNLSAFNIPSSSSSSNINSGKQQGFISALDSGCIVSEPLADDEHDQELKQVTHKSSHATVAGASVASDPMIFKHNVEGGMSEWFSKITLDTNQLGLTQSATGLNNFNSPAQQLQQTQRFASNKQQSPQYQTSQQQNTTIEGTPLNSSNAWERFYQQNDDGDTPLHIACAFGDVDIVAALIRMVPNPCLFDIQNDEGQTPLHIAARAQQPKILRMLVIAGAEPAVRDCRGNTALHLACDGGEIQCVNALTLKITQCEINGAHRSFGHRSTDNTMSFLKCADLPSDLEIRNYDGERCVHIAAQKGHMDILRQLELSGADINAREGRSGYTPLHIAILCNNDEIINFLLNECKNLNLEEMTYAGRTAYQIASALEKYQMTNILQERGAEPLTPPDSDYDSSDLESDDEKKQGWFGDHFVINSTVMVA